MYADVSLKEAWFSAFLEVDLATVSLAAVGLATTTVTRLFAKAICRLAEGVPFMPMGQSPNRPNGRI